ncbi:MAG: glutathione S-transferase family protein [Kiloniellaceae bacterium]
MTDFTIVLGNKAYSSWSLRGWLLLKQTGAAAEEVVIPLNRPETRERILRHSPSGRVPALKAGGLTVWDTLSIAEFLNERFPEAGLWPRDPEARALARSVSAEMHAGFATLRRLMPMDLRRGAPGRAPGPTGQLAADVARIAAIWKECRDRHGRSGDFLFGDFGAADAFYAPVATRFATYGVALDPTAAAYRDAVMNRPAMREWIAAAKAETWVIENP